jgi:4-amino-4-deoxychorismate lyase
VPQQTAFWLDGTPAASLPLPDRAADFGDGVFETLLLRNSKPQFLDMHFERLKQGLDALLLPDCLADARRQVAVVTKEIDKEWSWAALRISVIRGSGQRGYTPPQNQKPRLLMTASRIDRDCTKMSPAAKVSVAKIRLSTQPDLARIKHMNRLEQVLAAAQAQTDNVDECLMLDQSAQLISVIAGNVFLVRGNELLTPTLIDCGVAGTRRRLIIEKWAPAIGLIVREVTLSLADLQSAEEVFYSNSLYTVRSIERVAEQSWNKHTVCGELFQQFLEDME